MNTPRRILGTRVLVIALALVAACGGNVNVVKKQNLDLKPVNLPLRTFAFPSGLRVVVEKDTRTPLAGVFAVVGSGSSSDPKGKEGLAHYVEHLAFQSKPFGQLRFEDMLDAAGAIAWNASTNFDATTYYEIGPASALPQLLRAEAVRMVVPVSDISSSARKVELDVVRNELRERNETGFVGDVFSRMQVALFPPGHPNSSPIGGTHQSLSSLTKADADAFAKAHYRPDNLTIVIHPEGESVRVVGGESQWFDMTILPYDGLKIVYRAVRVFPVGLRKPGHVAVNVDRGSNAVGASQRRERMKRRAVLPHEG